MTCIMSNVLYLQHLNTEEIKYQRLEKCAQNSVFYRIKSTQNRAVLHQQQQQQKSISKFQQLNTAISIEAVGRKKKKE